MNDLLAWLSAMGQGTWPRFREAFARYDCESTSIQQGGQINKRTGINQARYNFARLGHVEFFTGEPQQAWRVTPPTLLLGVQGDALKACIVGARTPSLLDQISTSVDKYTKLTTVVQDGGPDAIYVRAEDQAAFDDLSNSLNMYMQTDCVTPLLWAAKQFSWGALALSAAPVGASWKIEKFNPMTLRWDDIEAPSANRDIELLRYSLPYRTEFLIQKNNAFYHADAAYAKYRVLRHSQKSVIEYDPEKEMLFVPQTCRPPLLLERALIGCSGLLPRRDIVTRKLCYSSIPYKVARAAADVLNQQLKRNIQGAA